jgi:hypothetical protein
MSVNPAFADVVIVVDPTYLAKQVPSVDQVKLPFPLENYFYLCRPRVHKQGPNNTELQSKVT